MVFVAKYLKFQNFFWGFLVWMYNYCRFIFAVFNRAFI